MKDDLPYFTHDNNAHRHPKMKALVAEYGMAGYGMFWILNERIAESNGVFIDITKKVNKLDLAQELGLTGDTFEEFLNFISDPEIDLINYQNGIITTDRTTEDYEKTMSKRKIERDKKIKGKNSHRENGDFPGENGDFPDDSPGKNIQNRQEQTRQEENREEQSKTDMDEFSPNDYELTDPEKLFLKIWQGAGDVFNTTARIESPKEWRHFWETSKTTCEQVKTALENCIADVRSGAIEPHFVASMPDRFVLKGGIQRHQKRFIPLNKTSPPPSKPQTAKKSLL
jgi:hypothetical protein